MLKCIHVSMEVKSYREIVTLLLNSGADITLKDHQGNVAIACIHQDQGENISNDFEEQDVQNEKRIAKNKMRALFIRNARNFINKKDYKGLLDKNFNI